MTITIMGWFGSGNFGDELILLSQLQLLKKHKFHIFSFNPKLTQKATQQHHEKILSIVKLGQKLAFFQTNFLGLSKAFNQSDLVLIGGGGMLQDAYNWYTAPYMGLFIFLAKIFTKPVGFFLIGAGPLNLFFSQKMVNLACKQADFIFTRDQHSQKVLEKIGVESKKITTLCDPVLALRVKPSTPKISKKTQYFIFCPREVGQWKKLNYQDVARSLDQISNRLNLKPLLLSLSSYTNNLAQNISEPKDYVIAQQISKHMKTKHTILKHQSISETMTLFQKSNFVISMRLHGLILAASLDIPFIGYSYHNDKKLKIFCEYLGLPDQNMFIHQPEKLISTAQSVLANKTHIVKVIQTQKRKLTRKLKKNTFDLSTVSNQPINFYTFAKYLFIGVVGSTYLIFKSILSGNRTFYGSKTS